MLNSVSSPRQTNLLRPAPISLAQRWARDAYSLPFADPVQHSLVQEFESLISSARRRLGWRLLRRKAWVHLSGQGRWLRPTVPSTAKRVLWIYTWTTLGDAIMDLSARHRVPQDVAVDLHIQAPLDSLFERDSRFGQVHSDATPMLAHYDFVLLQDLHAASLRIKAALAPRTPFATVMGLMQGEMYNRIEFAHHRLGQLFGAQPAPVTPPALNGMRQVLGPTGASHRTHMTVALGARDHRRHYPHWHLVLAHIVKRWPLSAPAPEFTLLGSGNAVDDVAEIGRAGLLDLCHVQVGKTSLAQAAELIASSRGFMSADGGLMHLAAALGKPGVGLFGPVPPVFRLLPGSQMKALHASTGMGTLAPGAVAQAMLDTLARA
jgi:hypothetical protein